MASRRPLDPNLPATGFDHKRATVQLGNARDSDSSGGIEPFPDYVDQLASALLDSPAPSPTPKLHGLEPQPPGSELQLPVPEPQRPAPQIPGPQPKLPAPERQLSASEPQRPAPQIPGPQLQLSDTHLQLPAPESQLPALEPQRPASESQLSDPQIPGLQFQHSDPQIPGLQLQLSDLEPQLSASEPQFSAPEPQFSAPEPLLPGPNGQIRNYIDKRRLKEMLDADGVDNEIDPDLSRTPASSINADFAPNDINTDNIPADVNTDNVPTDVNTDEIPADIDTDKTPAGNIVSLFTHVRRPVPTSSNILRGNDQESPTIPRKSSRRNLQGHAQKGLSPIFKTTLVKSKTGALVAQHVNGSHWDITRHGQTRDLPSSKTAPLNNYDFPASPVEVSEKTKAMLAHLQVFASPPKRKSRVARISSRVSGALSRFVSKKPAKNAGNRPKISLPLELTQATQHNQTIRVVDDTSIIQIGMSFPVMPTSPSVEGYDAPVPETPQQGNQSLTESSGIDVSIGDPFVDDTQFSDDLDDVLIDCPLAASTPRAPRRQILMPESSPLRRRAPNSGNDDSSFEERVPSESGEVRRREVRDGQQAVTYNPIQLPPPDFRVKKYPSPLPAALESLSERLKVLGPLAVKEGSDETGAEEGRDVVEDQIKTPQSVKTRIPGPLGSSRSTRFGLLSSEVDDLA